MSDHHTADPAAKLDYPIDWTNQLEDGETITDSTWEIPDGITEVEGKPSTIDGAVTTVWLTGGTAERQYQVTNHITTSAGREDERSIYLDVRDR